MPCWKDVELSSESDLFRFVSTTWSISIEVWWLFILLTSPLSSALLRFWVIFIHYSMCLSFPSVVSIGVDGLIDLTDGMPFGAVKGPGIILATLNRAEGN